MSDILEEINESALSVYKDAYAQRLPEATIPHHYLTVLLQWQEKMKRPENRDFVLSPKCKVRCFRPRERKDENYTIFIISGVEKQVNANYVSHVIDNQIRFLTNPCISVSLRVCVYIRTTRKRTNQLFCIVESYSLEQSADD